MGAIHQMFEVFLELIKRGDSANTAQSQVGSAEQIKYGAQMLTSPTKWTMISRSLKQIRLENFVFSLELLDKEKNNLAQICPK